MKSLKKMIALLLAVSVVTGMLAISASATAPDPEITARLLSEEEVTQLFYRSRMSETGTVFLPRNNAAGTNGNPCGAFVADNTSVAFAIKNAPGVTDFNVQLYVGELGAGYRAANYSCVSMGSGVSFYDLVVGKSYYFVVSSDTAPSGGITATYSFTTF